MNIREERKAARLSARQLGRMIGVTPTAVTRWESGQNTVKPEIAASLAAIFAAAKRGTVDINSTEFRVVEPRILPRYEFPASAIANLADVSLATVDNYRTGRHPVSPKTRRKIERAIAKLRAGQTGAAPRHDNKTPTTVGPSPAAPERGDALRLSSLLAERDKLAARVARYEAKMIATERDADLTEYDEWARAHHGARMVLSAFDAAHGDEIALLDAAHGDEIARLVAALKTDLPPLAIPEPPRPRHPPTVLPAPAPPLWQRVGAAVRRVFGKS